MGKFEDNLYFKIISELEQGQLPSQKDFEEIFQNPIDTLLIDKTGNPERTELAEKMLAQLDHLQRANALSVAEIKYSIVLSANLTLYYYYEEDDKEGYYWEEMQKYYEKLRKDPSLTSTETIQWTLVIGTTYQIIGYFHPALKAYRDAIDLLKHEKDKKDITNCFFNSIDSHDGIARMRYLNNPDNVDVVIKEYNKAIEIAEEAIPFLRNNKELFGKLLYIKAQFHFLLYDLYVKQKKAVEAFESINSSVIILLYIKIDIIPPIKINNIGRPQSGIEKANQLLNKCYEALENIANEENKTNAEYTKSLISQLKSYPIKILPIALSEESKPPRNRDITFLFYMSDFPFLILEFLSVKDLLSFASVSKFFRKIYDSFATYLYKVKYDNKLELVLDRHSIKPFMLACAHTNQTEKAQQILDLAMQENYSFFSDHDFLGALLNYAIMNSKLKFSELLVREGAFIPARQASKNFYAYSVFIKQCKYRISELASEEIKLESQLELKSLYANILIHQHMAPIEHNSWYTHHEKIHETDFFKEENLNPLIITRWCYNLGSVYFSIDFFSHAINFYKIAAEYSLKLEKGHQRTTLQKRYYGKLIQAYLKHAKIYAPDTSSNPAPDIQRSTYKKAIEIACEAVSKLGSNINIAIIYHGLSAQFRYAEHFYYRTRKDYLCKPGKHITYIQRSINYLFDIVFSIANLSARNNIQASFLNLNKYCIKLMLEIISKNNFIILLKFTEGDIKLAKIQLNELEKLILNQAEISIIIEKLQEAKLFFKSSKLSPTSNINKPSPNIATLISAMQRSNSPIHHSLSKSIQHNSSTNSVKLPPSIKTRLN